MTSSMLFIRDQGQIHLYKINKWFIICRKQGGGCTTRLQMGYQRSPSVCGANRRGQLPQWHARTQVLPSSQKGRRHFQSLNQKLTTCKIYTTSPTVDTARPLETLPQEGRDLIPQESDNIILRVLLILHENLKIISDLENAILQYVW